MTKNIFISYCGVGNLVTAAATAAATADDESVSSVPFPCVVCNGVLNRRGGASIITPSCGCGDRASMHFESCYQQRLLGPEGRCCPLCNAAFPDYFPINKFPRTPNIATLRVNVYFSNYLAHPVTIYWSSFEGVETFYANLHTEQEYLQGTYEGHVWIARTGVNDLQGRVVSYYIARQGFNWIVGN